MKSPISLPLGLNIGVSVTRPGRGTLPAMSMTWSDSHLIGEALYDKFPDKDPLSIRFTDLHKWTCELAGFEGDPKASSEGVLESIQMVWYEEWKLDNES